jgi:hypothetical protein
MIFANVLSGLRAWIVNLRFLKYLQLKMYVFDPLVDMQAARDGRPASPHAAGSDSIPNYVFIVLGRKKHDQNSKGILFSDMSLDEL